MGNEAMRREGGPGNRHLYHREKEICDQELQSLVDLWLITIFFIWKFEYKAVTENVEPVNRE